MWEDVEVEVYFKPLPESSEEVVQEGIKVTTCDSWGCQVPRVPNLTLDLVPGYPELTRVFCPYISAGQTEITTGTGVPHPQISSTYSERPISAPLTSLVVSGAVLGLAAIVGFKRHKKELIKLFEKVKTRANDYCVIPFRQLFPAYRT
jgi:hypothetical protein